MPSETLYDVDPPSLFDWQRARLLASSLDVSDRTLRSWFTKGLKVPTPGHSGECEVERLHVSGRAYYRLKAVDSEANGDPTPSEAPEGFQTPNWSELTLAWQAESASLRDRLLESRVEAERAKAEALEATLLAEVATRDVERFQAEIARAEALLESQRQELEAVKKERTALQRATDVPWYAFRKRRALLNSSTESSSI